MINLYWNYLIHITPAAWIRFFLIYTASLVVWFFIAMYYLRRKGHLLKEIGLLYPVVLVAAAIGVVGDVVYNWTFAIFIFADITRDLTISQRLRRYKTVSRYDGTWRQNIAISICRELNRQDPSGRHC
jgi:hypothetical protein